ncbi:MAG: Multifunctional conjugation protein TraI [Planctomycetes bacterium ADurb.Bin401]|nr:MAG: Multifunctional conjugation protein TraI [Planctomycetes bacterium ADurb.Bin401]
MKVDHQVNRNGDVQLHSHVVAFNMTFNKDFDKWQALHSDAFHSDILTLAYQNQLAYHAKQNGLTVEFVNSDSGRTRYAAIAGVPEAAIVATSERARQVDEYLEAHREELKEKYPNATDGELKQYAAYATRPAKKAMTLEQIQEQFAEKIAEKGLTQNDIINSVEAEKSKMELIKAEQELNSQKSGKGEQKKPLNAGDLLDRAAGSLTDTKSVFTRQELLRESLTMSHGDFSLNDLQLAMTASGAKRELTTLQNDHVVQDRHRKYETDVFTTRDILKTERQSIDTVLRGVNTVGAIETAELVDKFIEQRNKKSKFGMTEGQAKALKHILTSHDKYTFVQGYAGTGKTTVMEALRESALERDVNVIGISETNAAVTEMRESLGDAVTVTKFLHSNHKDINERSLIIVDESSFIGTKNFQKILDIAEKTGARVSFWGDKDQLPAVAAGTPFCRLVGENKVNFAKMTEIVRQNNEQYKSAVYDIINRDIRSALSKVEVIESERVSTILMTAGGGVGTGGGYIHSKEEFDLVAKNLKESSFFYKDGLDKLCDDPEKSRSALKQMVLGGWLTINEKKIDGKTYYSYDKTEYFGRDFKEIREEAKQLRIQAEKEAYGDLINSYIDKDYKGTIVSTYTNAMREQFNVMAREALRERSLIGPEGHKINVFVDKNVQGADRFIAANYGIGDKFLIQKSGAGIKIGTELIVKEVDARNNLIKAENEKGDLRTIDMRQHGDKVSAFEARTIKIGKGEKILFNKTWKSKGIINSDIGIIKDIHYETNKKTKEVSIKFFDVQVGNKTVKFDPKEFNHFEHGYAVTTYAAQGKTSRNAITLEGRAFQDVYVSASRGKKKLVVFARNKEDFIKNAREELFKEMAKDYTGEKTKATGKTLSKLQKELNIIDKEIQWQAEQKKLAAEIEKAAEAVQVGIEKPKGDPADAQQKALAEKVEKRKGIAQKIDEIKGAIRQIKTEREYEKYAKKLSNRHRKDLFRKPTRKDLAKATGWRSVILNSKSTLSIDAAKTEYTTTHPTVRTEAGYWEAWKNRAIDHLKKSITKKNYKTRTYDVFKKDKNGNLLWQKQVTSYKMDRKGNGYFESLTFHADGKIDRFYEVFYKGEKVKVFIHTIEKPDSLKSRFVPILEKSQRENLTEKGNGNLKSLAEIFEKSEVGKTENLKEVGPQKSEKSEFEKEIYQQGDLSKNEKFERQIEIER